MLYAQVRLSISSSLRTNDALFGCTSRNGYAYSVPPKWVVQSPGVTNNKDVVNHTLLVHFVTVLVLRLYSYTTALAARINRSGGFSKKPGEHFPIQTIVYVCDSTACQCQLQCSRGAY